jgi:hypothetical protein
MTMLPLCTSTHLSPSTPGIALKCLGYATPDHEYHHSGEHGWTDDPEPQPELPEIHLIKIRGSGPTEVRYARLQGNRWFDVNSLDLWDVSLAEDRGKVNLVVLPDVGTFTVDSLNNVRDGDGEYVGNSAGDWDFMVEERSLLLARAIASRDAVAKHKEPTARERLLARLEANPSAVSLYFNTADLRAALEEK